MKPELHVRLVRVLVEVVDSIRVERARAADDAVDLVTLLEEELRQVAAVLPRDASDECPFHYLIPASNRWRERSPERASLAKLRYAGRAHLRACSSRPRSGRSVNGGTRCSQGVPAGTGPVRCRPLEPHASEYKRVPVERIARRVAARARSRLRHPSLSPDNAFTHLLRRIAGVNREGLGIAGEDSSSAQNRVIPQSRTGK